MMSFHESYGTSATALAVTGTGKQKFGGNWQDARDDRGKSPTIFHCGRRAVERIAMPSNLERFQARAARCRDYAAAAKSATNRNHWLKLADQWAKLAEAEAKRVSMREQSVTTGRGLHRVSMPYTRENYILLNWGRAIPASEWTVEHEKELPEDLQDWSIFSGTLSIK
jgi:hypothetical protein